MRKWLKQLVHIFPWPLTLNEKYDRETKAVLKRVCNPDSICVDVGCFKGDILKAMMDAAPRAKHFAFEPTPVQYAFLKNQFGEKVNLFPYALGNGNSTTSFQYVKSNPTYSGLRPRQYKREEEIETIQVELRRMDDVISPETPVHLIKIDVEGGELDVLLGAQQLLSRHHPFLIFEHGLGGSDKYGTMPSDIFALLVDELGYKISLMENFMAGKNKKGFSIAEFEDQFHRKLNCYFMAIPPDEL